MTEECSQNEAVQLREGIFKAGRLGKLGYRLNFENRGVFHVTEEGYYHPEVGGNLFVIRITRAQHAQLTKECNMFMVKDGYPKSGES